MSYKMIKKIYLLFSLLVLFTVPSSYVLANENGPLAEIYLTNHPQITVSGTTYSVLNTTMNRTNRRTEINNMGYNCHDYVNIQAGPKTESSIMRTLGNDAVFTVFGHANHGRICCIDNNNNLTRIAANSTDSSNNYSLEYNYENTNNQLKKMRFAHFAGCKTYGYSSTYGNLTTKARTCKVDVVLTHKDSLYPTPGTYFSYLIFYYGRTKSNSATIKSCIEDAQEYALEYYDNSSNAISTMDIHIGGYDTSSKFKPASYGS